jgi:hypothetical protein
MIFHQMNGKIKEGITCSKGKQDKTSCVKETFLEDDRTRDSRKQGSLVRSFVDAWHFSNKNDK